MHVIAESLDYVCADRLRPNLVWLAAQPAAHGEMETAQALLDQLGQISVSTVKRRLSRIRQDQAERGGSAEGVR